MKITALALCAAMSVCTPAYALNCAPTVVADQYHESTGFVAASTAMADGALIVTYANPITRAFVIVIETPDGLTCLLAAGNDFEQLHWGFDT